MAAHFRVTQGDGGDGTDGANDNAVCQGLESGRLLQRRERMDGGGAEKKNGVGMSNRFPTGGVNFRSVNGAIGDDVGDFSAKFLEARNKFAGSAIASRKKYASPAELEC